MLDDIIPGIVCVDVGTANEWGVDYVVRNSHHDVEVLLMEYKCRWKLDVADPMPVSAADVGNLPGLVSEYFRILSQGLPRPHWMYAIGQCTTYMIANKLRFCILSTLNFFYVLHLPTARADSLHISDRFSVTFTYDSIHGAIISSRPASADQGLVLAALQAHVGFSVFLPAQGIPVDQHGQPLPDVNEIVYKMAFLFVIRRALLSTKFTGNGPTLRLRTTGSRDKDPDHDADEACEPVEVDSFSEKLQLLGEGRSGAVFKASLRGVPVAIKIESKEAEDITALDRERAVYQRFEALQGVYLPKIACYKVRVVGELYGLGMQVLKMLPVDFGCWSLEQRNEVKQLLLALVNHGLFQQDLRAENFGINDEGKIVMYDLEDVVCAGDDEDTEHFRKMYIAMVERLFDVFPH